jgi:hypothetical protein
MRGGAELLRSTAGYQLTVAGAPVAFGGLVVVVGGAMLAGGTSPISALADFGGRSRVHWHAAVPSVVLNEQSTTWPLGKVQRMPPPGAEDEVPPMLWQLLTKVAGDRLTIAKPGFAQAPGATLSPTATATPNVPTRAVERFMISTPQVSEIDTVGSSTKSVNKMCDLSHYLVTSHIGDVTPRG